MNANLDPVDVLDIIDKVAVFNGGYVADDLCRVGERVEQLLDVAQKVVDSPAFSIYRLVSPLSELNAAIAACRGAGE